MITISSGPGDDVVAENKKRGNLSKKYTKTTQQSTNNGRYAGDVKK